MYSFLEDWPVVFMCKCHTVTNINKMHCLLVNLVLFRIVNNTTDHPMWHKKTAVTSYESILNDTEEYSCENAEERSMNKWNAYTYILKLWFWTNKVFSHHHSRCSRISRIRFTFPSHDVVIWCGQHLGLEYTSFSLLSCDYLKAIWAVHVPC